MYKILDSNDNNRKTVYKNVHAHSISESYSKTSSKSRARGTKKTSDNMNRCVRIHHHKTPLKSS
jgi:hypothetical protein